MGKFKKFFNFDNVGGKIKNLVKWYCWISIIVIWIGAAITFLVSLGDDDTIIFALIALTAAAVMPFSIWVSSWFMYGFGELIENTRGGQGMPTEVPTPTQTLTAQSPAATPIRRYGDFEFETTGYGVRIVKYKGSSTDVVIPSYINEGKVVSVGNSAFYGCSFVISVSIPNSVMFIGPSAFCGCASLKFVSIPDSITSISPSAFEGCPLETIYFQSEAQKEKFKDYFGQAQLIVR